jgi:hypothetical protein
MQYAEYELTHPNIMMHTGNVQCNMQNMQCNMQNMQYKTICKILVTLAVGMQKKYVKPFEICTIVTRPESRLCMFCIRHSTIIETYALLMYSVLPNASWHSISTLDFEKHLKLVVSRFWD